MVGLIVLVLLWWFSPRSSLRGSVTFTCSECGRAITVHRWEPISPHRRGLRFPGWHWTSTSIGPSLTTQPTTENHQHVYDGKVFVEMDGGWFTGTWSDGAVLVNGMDLSPETAGDVLRELMAPDNSGISVQQP